MIKAKDFQAFLSFSASKSALVSIYSQNRILPLSGRSYNFSDKSCSLDGYVKHEGELVKVLWRGIIPESILGQNMACMSERLCHSSFSDRNFSGAMCCRRISKKFKNMVSDMHQIIPTFNKENNASLIHLKKVHHRGMIARSVLYMLDTYSLSLSKILKEKFLKWHENHPVSAWERIKNRKIFQLQGTFNPYIEKL